VTPYQEFIYKRSYSRWIPEKGRRENWDETVSRYADFFAPRVPSVLLDWFDGAIESVRKREIMPSMRCLWSAGAALENDHIAGYNCAYTAMDSVKSFSEILYILMNGAGVGFSTERQYINLLPAVPSTVSQGTLAFTWVVEDSKLGWAEAYDALLRHLYEGFVIKLDLSLIRPKGAPLKTFGGRASGPEPLLQLIKFTVNTFKNAAGRKLNSLEVYDLVCMIANCVVSGGVRRSSTINLSNLTDIRMRDAKVGQFYLEHPQRMLSNNSVVYTEKPDMGIFTEEWLHLMRSGSGERGIINRESLQGSAAQTGREERDFGTNPCGEIILRNKQFCNLTEVIVRPWDNYYSLKRKVMHATLLGCLQSGLTSFKYLSPEWKANCEEERLLGLSLTGLMDNLPIWNNLKDLREVAWSYAKDISEEMGITCPKAITCVKPSGTVSQLVGCASGIHPRHSPFFIRRVRVSSTDPVARLLLAQEVPHHPETGQEEGNANTLVFDFPQEAPKNSVFRGLPALTQLDAWLKVKQDWCDHNPSCTIYVREHEWLEVGAWIYRNWDWVGGLSFLPYDGGIYELAPYEEISEETYKTLTQNTVDIDWSLLHKYERNDNTEGAKTYACTGDKCELF
jgi:ribonucleoside-triphosphate reductase